MLWKMKIPVLSTAHIKKHTLEVLARTSPELVADYPEGAFIHISGARKSGLTDLPELSRVAKWFRKKYPKEKWLRLDCDGDIVEALPTFDW